MQGRSEALEKPGRPAGTEDFVLEIPPDAEHVRTARLFAASVARHFEAEDERVEDLKVAISEACTNAINAHRAAGVSDAIRLVARSEEGAISFDVVDAGRGFDPDDALAANDYTPPMGLFEGSLGLALIRSLFPDAQIVRNDGRGMTVTIAVER